MVIEVGKKKKCDTTIEYAEVSCNLFKESKKM